jgi:ElaB/YqjD/DUF883 family membrane-anchored ribosome-binding protein
MLQTPERWRQSEGQTKRFLMFPVNTKVGALNSRHLEADCNKIVDETVDYARQGMEEFKKEEQAVIKEMREECNKQEEQAAELKFQLQERVDELVEK